MSALPPRPKGLLRGYVSMLRDPPGFALQCRRELGQVADLSLLGMRMVLIHDPALIEHVLLKDQHLYIKDALTRGLDEVVGNGLLVSEGDFWKRQRRLMQPAFHQRRIAEYARTMVTETQSMLEGWSDGEARDLHADMMTLTLRIVARALFGSGISDADAGRVETAIAEIMRRYLGIFGSGIVLPLAVPTPGARRFRRQIAALDRILLEIIRARRAGAGRDAGSERGDLLDMLLEMQDEDGTRMTDSQLRDECMTLFLAGHETTALNLTYAFHLLGHHPDARDRLEQELADVLGGREPEMADLPRLPFTRAVVNEALRLYPPAWSIGREPTEDVTLGDYPIAAGTQIWIAPWVTHREPEHFPEPEAFRPERWLDGLDKRLPRYVFMPFGGGPRICIGNAFAMTEAVLALATIAQRFELEPTGGRELELVPSVTLRPKGGLPVRVRTRTAQKP